MFIKQFSLNNVKHLKLNKDSNRTQINLGFNLGNIKEFFSRKKKKIYSSLEVEFNLKSLKIQNLYYSKCIIVSVL